MTIRCKLLQIIPESFEEQVNVASPTATNFDVSRHHGEPLLAGETFSFLITAVNAAGEGAFSTLHVCCCGLFVAV